MYYYHQRYPKAECKNIVLSCLNTRAHEEDEPKKIWYEFCNEFYGNQSWQVEHNLARCKLISYRNNGQNKVVISSFIIHHYEANTI